MTLPVYYEQTSVGRIEVDERGPNFSYDPSWPSTRGAFPISTRMPFSGESDSAFLTAWLANILPESDQLEAVLANLGASSGDVVTVVEAMGRDTAGALSFAERGTSERRWVPVAGPDALERVIEELPRKPFLIGDEGMSMSLAGAQTKMGVAVDEDGAIHLPVDGSPSTHILKPNISRLPGSVENEALCMRLANLIGLGAPETSIGRAGSRSYLLVRRYDRSYDGHRILRHHQEDFCQALGYLPTSKYERNQTGRPGPTFRDGVRMIRAQAGATDLLKLVSLFVFNVLIANTDAHAKNYSLLIRPRGISMAPPYDLMSGEYWENVTQNMAQTVDGKNRGRYLERRHWEREAKACGLSPSMLLNRIKAMGQAIVDRLPVAIDSLDDGTNQTTLRLMAEGIAERTRTVVANSTRGPEMKEGTASEDQRGRSQPAGEDGTRSTPGRAS